VRAEAGRERRRHPQQPVQVHQAAIDLRRD
jgi:hypothetical protein